MTPAEQRKSLFFPYLGCGETILGDPTTQEEDLLLHTFMDQYLSYQE